ncbi:MAG: UGSC family (seleno)protein [Acidimicrobiales bacterium]
MLRASAAAEAAGVASASLVCEGFLGQAATTAVGLGMPNLPAARMVGHVDTQVVEELTANILTVTVPELVDCLTRQPDDAAEIVEPEAREVVFVGDFDEVNRLFYENRWSDGLPIVPPTAERVEAFLAFCDLAPEHSLGRVLPDNRECTVWSVAVNGVMAGCRPEYMPVLVALAEAMADPAYGVEHSGNTPGAETLITINGPLIGQLGFNYEQGVLRDGFQANTSIGRWWRLYLRNVAGFLPHLTDKGTYGNTWRVVLAENEAVLARIGWPPLASDFGFAQGDNVVTISRYTGGDVLASVFGQRPEEMVPYLADALAKQAGWELVFTMGVGDGTYRPLLLLSPILAETIAKAGWSRDQLKRALWEAARIPAWKFEKYLGEWTNLYPGRRSLEDFVNMRRAPRVFAESSDPNRLVPLTWAPEDILVAVTGDPLRTNAYVFSHNGMLGFPTAKRVRLPERWEAKLAAARQG